jgi:glycosyltransferase involved in cell wall biosynthesis
MKVAVMIDEVRFGGPEKIAAEEVRALSELGHEAVLVVLRRTSSKAYSDLLSKENKIFFSDLLPRPLRISFRFPFFRFFSLFHLTYAVLIRFVPLGARFDAVISHGTFTCFSGLMLARAKSIPALAYVWDPIVHILRTTYLRSETARMSCVGRVALAVGAVLDRWICKNASLVLTSSRYHISYLKQVSPRSSKVKLLLPGVHVRKSVRTERLGYAISATAWKLGKDPEYLLELASRLDNLRLIIAGAWISESLKNSFLNRMTELNLSDRVSVTGPVGEDTLLEAYSQALVFLQVHTDVGFGLPALEAAGQACTFIIAEGQGVCDLFSDGKEGFMVEEKNTDKILGLLRRLSEKPEEAVSMGRDALEVAQHHSWNTHAQQIYEMVRECQVTLDSN